MTRLVRARGTPPWAVLYAVGLLCVLSFVLFEVLDVDGSEFRQATSRLSIKLGEAEHDDVKRISLRGAGLGPTPVVIVAVVTPPRASTRPLTPARPGSPPLARIARAALARALLPDAPPSV